MNAAADRSRSYAFRFWLAFAGCEAVILVGVALGRPWDAWAGYGWTYLRTVALFAPAGWLGAIAAACVPGRRRAWPTLLGVGLTLAAAYALGALL